MKITPVNPTISAIENRVVSAIDPMDKASGKEFIDRLVKAGYDVILSIGELKENKNRSNCGQYIRKFLGAGKKLDESYKYRVFQV